MCLFRQRLVLAEAGEGVVVECVGARAADVSSSSQPTRKMAPVPAQLEHRDKDGDHFRAAFASHTSAPMRIAPPDLMRFNISEAFSVTE